MWYIYTCLWKDAMVILVLCWINGVECVWPRELQQGRPGGSAMMTDTAEAWTQNVTGLEGKISTPETMGFSQEIFGVFRFFDFPPKKTSNEKITGLLISQYWKSMVKFCENPQLKSENPDAKGFHHENFITTLLKSRCQKHILWETKKIWELQIWMCFISHGIHVWHILYANIWGILMVNVTIYSIHGSYGYHEFKRKLFRRSEIRLSVLFSARCQNLRHPPLMDSSSFSWYQWSWPSKFLHSL